MIETIVNYKSEYILDENGNRKTFAVNASVQFLYDNNNELIPDKKGKPYRQWRDHIRTNQDIWDELVKAAKIPGTTSAPKLQPISARIVMLQSGMRAPMGLKVKGPDLKTIEQTGETIEKLLKQVPSINPETVIADRIIGKPYLEIEIDREAIARYGLSIQQVQSVIEVAIGGMPVTKVIEGRERYPVRVRYMRELRDNYEDLSEILVPVSPQKQIPLGQLAKIQYVRGPQMIKSEDTFLTGYVLFDKNEGQAEVDVVEEAQQFLADKIKSGDLILPAGVSYQFAGSYQNQIRATNVLKLILPISLLVIFFILYLQFRKIPVTLIVFSGIIISWAGGFIMLWLYAQDWFLNFSLFGQNLQTIFQLHPINLSVAVWVGFLALFGVASDDGVIISTFLEQQFDKRKPDSVQKIREATIEAGKRRIRPAMMTISTTILALIPVLTSTGRGSDIMTPMAIPLFGGMSIGIITTFVVPVLYSALAEFKLNRSNQNKNEE